MISLFIFIEKGSIEKNIKNGALIITFHNNLTNTHFERRMTMAQNTFRNQLSFNNLTINSKGLVILTSFNE